MEMEVCRLSNASCWAPSLLPVSLDVHMCQKGWKVIVAFVTLGMKAGSHFASQMYHKQPPHKNTAATMEPATMRAIEADVRRVLLVTRKTALDVVPSRPAIF